MSSEELLLGKNPVLAALDAGRPLNKLILARGLTAELAKTFVRLAADKHVPVEWADKRQLDRLAGGRRHQGVIAVASAKPYVPFEDLVKSTVDAGKNGVLIIADGIQDPQNLGAIVRCVEEFGANGLVITRKRSCGLTSAVSRASAGALEYVPVARVSSMINALKRIRSAGIWLIGADQDAPQVCYGADLSGPLAIVLGSEGGGLSGGVKKYCDFLVRIPQFGRVGSLNVSVACGIILYEVIRQRSQFA